MKQQQEKRAHFALWLRWMHLEFQKALEKVRNNEVMRKAKDWGTRGLS